MKTKVRNGVIAAALAGVALSSALCLTTGNYSALADEVITEPENNLVPVEQALKTVGNDLESIVTGYNKVFGTEWAATGIEYSSPVYLIEDNEYGMYLDLDADNGYAVMTTNKKIYRVETNGDLEYLRNVDDIYFSYMDGFMYIDDNEQFRKYEQNKEDIFMDGIVDSPAKKTDDHFNAALALTSSSTIYPGQIRAGDDGEIDPRKIDAYVSARYPGFTFNKKDVGIVSGFEYSIQDHTSYYIKLYDK
ncbi:MAG: hypothetical protein HDT28_03185 [Clostridiales bacterium]|nr:hypothetical protein [Clostridiales bacterium]